MQIEKIEQTSQQLHTQDNRCTTDPMFCVQVCERVGPIVPMHSENLMFYDRQELRTYYEDQPDVEKWKHLKSLHDAGCLPKKYWVGGYVEIWKTVQVCFTEKGCQQHLEENGHNYRHYNGVRIYIDSFYRNPEMIAIRNFLMSNHFRQENILENPESNGKDHT